MTRELLPFRFAVACSGHFGMLQELLEIVCSCSRFTALLALFCMPGPRYLEGLRPDSGGPSLPRASRGSEPQAALFHRCDQV